MLVDTISKHRLGLKDVEPDILGRAYEYLLRKFAEGSGQSAGEFYTPSEVAVLMAHIVDPQPGEEIFDPCVGSGGLLIKCHLLFRERYDDDPNVRSLKFFGQEILALEHDAIYVHIGWSPMAMADIPKLGVNNINGAYGVFWDITNDKSNWQDTYTSMEKLEEYAKKVNYRTTTDKEMVFKYHNRDQELEGGKKAEKINLSYSGEYKSYYEYDADKKLYLRFRNGKPHIERQTGEQLTTKNIIIQKVRNYDIKGDQYGRQNLDTVGSGEGYYITNGKCIEIKWSKASRTEKTRQRNSFKSRSDMGSDIPCIG